MKRRFEILETRPVGGAFNSLVVVPLDLPHRTTTDKDVIDLPFGSEYTLSFSNELLAWIAVEA